MNQAKQAFHQARDLIDQARTIVTPHLDRYLHPLIYRDFDTMIRELNNLAIEGALEYRRRTPPRRPRRPRKR